MPAQQQTSNWTVAWLAALSLAVLALIGAVVFMGSRLSDGARVSAGLADRLTQATAAAGKADARIAALEKSAADAKADRDALRDDARKAAAAIETALSSLAATESGLESAAERLASLEPAMAETKAAQESLREGYQKSSAEIDAMKPALDQATAALGVAGQNIAALATRIDGLKSDEDALRRDSDKNAGAIQATASTVATLRSYFAWRDLSPDTQSRLSAALAKLGANGVNLVYISGDFEFASFRHAPGGGVQGGGMVAQLCLRGLSGNPHHRARPQQGRQSGDAGCRLGLAGERVRRSLRRSSPAFAELRRRRRGQSGDAGDRRARSLLRIWPAQCLMS